MASLGGEPCSQVKLSIECRNLPNMDTFSKSDPFVVVSIKEKNGRWRELGRTETIMNNLNPKFTTTIHMDYYFEQKQELQFLVYDEDSKSRDLANQDFIGSLETSLGTIVGSRGSCLTRALEGAKGANEKKYGAIKILAEEMNAGKGDALKLQISGSKLVTKDWFGKGDHYLVFKRQRQDQQFELVHKTEVIKNSKDPLWMRMEIPLAKLNLGNMETPIVIEIWDWNAASSHDFLGQVTTTVSNMLGTMRRFAVTKPQSKNPNRDRGELIVNSAEIFRTPSFLEFVRGGTSINVVVAVDFTLSNGHPMDPKSLHFNQPGTWNAYQQAIISVGEIVEKYSCDKRFEAYGFGGRLPGQAKASFCFALNGNANAPLVNGVQGILDAYSGALNTVELYGPTNFAQIIQKAHECSRRSPPNMQEYVVLLILTDGEITDMENTVDAIINASGSPLSIVIVGIGPADFRNMHRLDGDEQRLTSMNTGKFVERDIVQFVSFRDLKDNGPLLAKEVLHEIPDQLTSYYASRNIRPNQAPEVPSNWEAQLRSAASFRPAPPGVAAPRAFDMASIRDGLVPQPAQAAGAPVTSLASWSEAPPPPMDAPPPYVALPPGWEEKIDPGSNRPYYVNHATRQTQWDRPTDAGGPPPPPPYQP